MANKKVVLIIEAEMDEHVSEGLLARALNKAINQIRVTPGSKFVAMGGDLVKLGYVDWTEAHVRRNIVPKKTTQEARA